MTGLSDRIIVCPHREEGRARVNRAQEKYLVYRYGKEIGERSRQRRLVGGQRFGSRDWGGESGHGGGATSLTGHRHCRRTIRRRFHGKGDLDGVSRNLNDVPP